MNRVSFTDDGRTPSCEGFIVSILFCIQLQAMDAEFGIHANTQGRTALVSSATEGFIIVLMFSVHLQAIDAKLGIYTNK